MVKTNPSKMKQHADLKKKTPGLKKSAKEKANAVKAHEAKITNVKGKIGSHPLKETSNSNLTTLAAKNSDAKELLDLKGTLANHEKELTKLQGNSTAAQAALNTHLANINTSTKELNQSLKNGKNKTAPLPVEQQKAVNSLTQIANKKKENFQKASNEHNKSINSLASAHEVHGAINIAKEPNAKASAAKAIENAEKGAIITKAKKNTAEQQKVIAETHLQMAQSGHIQKLQSKFKNLTPAQFLQEIMKINKGFRTIGSKTTVKTFVDEYSAIINKMLNSNGKSQLSPRRIYIISNIIKNIFDDPSSNDINTQILDKIIDMIDKDDIMLLSLIELIINNICISGLKAKNEYITILNKIKDKYGNIFEDYIDHCLTNNAISCPATQLPGYIAANPPVVSYSFGSMPTSPVVVPQKRSMLGSIFGSSSSSAVVTPPVPAVVTPTPSVSPVTPNQKGGTYNVSAISILKASKPTSNDEINLFLIFDKPLSKYIPSNSFKIGKTTFKFPVNIEIYNVNIISITLQKTFITSFTINDKQTYFFGFIRNSVLSKAGNSSNIGVWNGTGTIAYNYTIKDYESLVHIKNNSPIKSIENDFIKLIRYYENKYGNIDSLEYIDAITKYGYKPPKRINAVILDIKNPYKFVAAEAYINTYLLLVSGNTFYSKFNDGLKKIISTIPDNDRILFSKEIAKIYMENYKEKTTLKMPLKDIDDKLKLIPATIKINKDNKNKLDELYKTSWEAANNAADQKKDFADTLYEIFNKIELVDKLAVYIRLVINKTDKLKSVFELPSIDKVIKRKNDPEIPSIPIDTLKEKPLYTEVCERATLLALHSYYVTNNFKEASDAASSIGGYVKIEEPFGGKDHFVYKGSNKKPLEVVSDTTNNLLLLIPLTMPSTGRLATDVECLKKGYYVEYDLLSSITDDLLV